MSNMSNSASIPPEVAAWCETYAGFSLTLAHAFLILAFIVALVETALTLWVKLQAARKGPEVTETAVRATKLVVDPVKFLEALKGVLEALKGLPAWIAIFLAGLALLWTSANATPAYCPGQEIDEANGQQAPQRPQRMPRNEVQGNSNTS